MTHEHRQKREQMGRARLEPGHDTIDTCTCFKLKDGRNCLRWKIRLWNGKLLDRKTVGNYTNSELKQRARATAEKLRASSGAPRTWTPASVMADYVRQQVIPDMQADTKLRPNTVKNYTRHLGYYAEETSGLVIADAVRPTVLDATVQAIAAQHGYDVARQTEKLIRNRVLASLVHREVIAGNPLREYMVPLDLATKRKKQKVIPTHAEQQAFLSWLVTVKPEDMPTKGHSRSEDRMMVVDLTLVQATMGARIDELLRLTRDCVSTDEQGNVYVTVTEYVSKTHKERTCLLLDDRAAERLRARVTALEAPDALVFHAPGAPGRRWEESNAGRALKRFFKWAAVASGVPVIEHVRSHAWRTSLNDYWRDELGIPDHERAAYLGHTEGVNAKSYTGHMTLSTLYEKGRAHL